MKFWNCVYFIMFLKTSMTYFDFLLISCAILINMKCFNMEPHGLKPVVPDFTPC